MLVYNLHYLGIRCEKIVSDISGEQIIIILFCQFCTFHWTHMICSILTMGKVSWAEDFINLCCICHLNSHTTVATSNKLRTSQKVITLVQSGKIFHKCMFLQKKNFNLSAITACNKA